MEQPEQHDSPRPAPVPEPYVNRFELTIVAELDVVKAEQPSKGEEGQ